MTIKNALARVKSRIVSFCILLEAGVRDILRYHRFSRSFINVHRTGIRAHITVQYHVIEKGLTMPNFRRGFGQEQVVGLGKKLLDNTELIADGDSACMHALQVMKEYAHVHEGYDLQDETKKVLMAVLKLSEIEGTRQHQSLDSSFNYFEHKNSSFDLFSKSRKSLRNFSDDEVSMDGINRALDLCRHAPSACNRQSWRTYVFTEKGIIRKILELQGGNRGFGHLSNKLIVVTSEVGVFCQANERNQAFVDGGMYAMNLLYCLHHYEIGACVMNCSFFPKKERQLREVCGIKDSEVFIVMVACGKPGDNLRIAHSPRYTISETNTIK